MNAFAKNFHNQRNEYFVKEDDYYEKCYNFKDKIQKNRSKKKFNITFYIFSQDAP